CRGRRTSDGGFEFGTTLPRGTILHDDDCYVLDEQRIDVRVVELPEAVLVVEPSVPADWAVFGYHIGNSHQPVMILDAAILCPDGLGMRHRLEQHAIPFSRAVLPSTPLPLQGDHVHRPA